MSFETIATTIGLILTGVGLLYTGYQISGSKKIARAEFLLKLDEMLHTYNETHVHFRPGGIWGDGRTGPKTANEWVPVERYMGLFERINILVEDQIVDLHTIEKLYGYRLINLSENEIVHSEKLVNNAESWSDFIKLRDKIYKIQRNKNKWWNKIFKS